MKGEDLGTESLYWAQILDTEHKFLKSEQKYLREGTVDPRDSTMDTGIHTAVKPGMFVISSIPNNIC